MTISALCFFNVSNRATFSRIFERDMDVAVSLYDETIRARAEGREPISFATMEQRVDARRREDRRVERALKEAEGTAG